MLAQATTPVYIRHRQKQLLQYFDKDGVNLSTKGLLSYFLKANRGFWSIGDIREKLSIHYGSLRASLRICNPSHLRDLPFFYGEKSTRLQNEQSTWPFKQRLQDEPAVGVHLLCRISKSNRRWQNVGLQAGKFACTETSSLAIFLKIGIRATMFLARFGYRQRNHSSIGSLTRHEALSTYSKRNFQQKR